MRTKSILLAMVVFMVTCGVATVRAATTYSYIYFDVPGIDNTTTNASITGVNSSGTVVGYYTYTDSSHTLHYKSFSRTLEKVYTSIVVDGADVDSTRVSGINDSGLIVGQCSVPRANSGSGRSFTLSNGLYQLLDNPDFWDFSANAVNNLGWVVGQCDGYGATHPGCAYMGGAWSTLTFPDAIQFTLNGIDIYNIRPFNVNDTGQILGTYVKSDGTSAYFMLQGGTYYTTSDLSAVPSGWTNPYPTTGLAQYASAYSSNGILAGSYQNSTTKLYHNFIAIPNTGDPNGIDWAMPNHLVAGDDYTKASQNQWGLVSHDYIYPPAGWTVNLYLTTNGQKSGPQNGDPLVEWRWEVSPTDSVMSAPAAGGVTTMKVRDFGIYTVTAKKYTRATTSDTFSFTGGVQLTQQVIVRDFLVVGMGDSNGSGEGNPPWILEQCNRSQESYQFKVAQYLEEQDPHSSVTFIFPACSGARIEHLSRLPYYGVRGNSPLVLPPQLTQVNQLLRLTGATGEPAKPRAADAVIMSVGINNLYFGSLMKFCIINDSPAVSLCKDIKARLLLDPSPSASPGARMYVSDSNSGTTINDLLTGLLTDNFNMDYRYMDLNIDLTKSVADGGLGVLSNHVFITQYPDFSHDANGLHCDTSAFTSDSLVKWNSSTWGWFNDKAVQLNNNVAQSARNGWQVAVLDQSQFKTHGYCAGTLQSALHASSPAFATVPYFSGSYFLGIFDGVLNHNLDGAFHPIKPGHALTANAVKPLICTTLFNNGTCQGPPPY